MHLVLREVGLRGRFTGKDVSGTLYNLGPCLSEYPYYSVSPLGLISGVAPFTSAPSKAQSWHESPSSSLLSAASVSLPVCYVLISRLCTYHTRAHISPGRPSENTTFHLSGTEVGLSKSESLQGLHILHRGTEIGRRARRWRPRCKKHNPASRPVNTRIRHVGLPSAPASSTPCRLVTPFCTRAYETRYALLSSHERTWEGPSVRRSMRYAE